jgi:hypothetical protein
MSIPLESLFQHPAKALYALRAAESSSGVVHRTRDEAEADPEHFDGKTTE